jgi:hypothetical protein
VLRWCPIIKCICKKEAKGAAIITVKRIKCVEVEKIKGRCSKRQKTIIDQQECFKKHKSLVEAQSDLT